MRFASALIGLTVLTFASTAAAQTVTLSPIGYSTEFQEELRTDLGEREGDYLRDMVIHAVDDAIARRGVSNAAPVQVEITIVDAQPNRFTFNQLRTRPGVDYSRSVSVGGAELSAVLRGPDGAVIAEVEHRRYSDSLSDLFTEPTTWTDARRAIRQFAAKVADAYVAHASAR